MMDEEEEVYVSPGPGNYLQPFHTTTFGKNSILHEYPQNFGSTVRRFREQPVGCILGPGQYMFGLRKIMAKLINGKLVIRVGGGYMYVAEFIE